MEEKEKADLIQAINEMRKELNLEPYPPEHLETKDAKELRKFYYQYFQLREDYRKKSEGEKQRRFRSSLKKGLLIGVTFIVIIISIISIQFISKGGEGKKSLPFFPFAEGKKLGFNISFAYCLSNDPVFVLVNSGNMNISSFATKIDGDDKNYSIVSGELPLEPLQTVDFKIDGMCDDSTHNLTVVSEDVKQDFNFKESQSGDIRD